MGSPCHAYVEKEFRKEEHHKANAEPCLFIGYDARNNGYLVYNPATRRVLTRDAIKCDEAYVGGVDVLKGTYTKTIDDINEPVYHTPGAPRRPRPVQADVDKLFSPSINDVTRPSRSATPKRRTLVCNIDAIGKAQIGRAHV